MANWNDLQDEIRLAGTTHDSVRRKYLKQLSELTGRNAIIYYAGWLQQQHVELNPWAYSINESDKTGFMSALHGMDKSKGLDLLLHTPGGSVSDTESLVEYLRSFFNGDIRAVVPQVAQSAGTMIALACCEIVMGRQSRLGPIDPQFAGLPAQTVVQEYEKAAQSLREDPDGEGQLWLNIVMKYPPAFYTTCVQAMEWSREMVTEWLKTGMFKDDPEAAEKAANIASELSDTTTNKSHDRQISVQRLKQLGVKVVEMEDNQYLQDAILTVHHATIQTLAARPVCKIIENQDGVASMTGFRPA